MQVPQIFIGAIKTMVQRAVELFLALPAVIMGLSWLSENLGLAFDPTDITNALSIFVIGLVTMGVNWVSGRWSWAAKVFSLFTTNSSPGYVPTRDTTAIVTVNGGTTVETGGSPA